MKTTTVYLVFENIDYDGISLEDAKVFINKADAIKYKEQLEQPPFPSDAEIKEMELN
jgi:hypothetical protein